MMRIIKKIILPEMGRHSIGGSGPLDLANSLGWMNQNGCGAIIGPYSQVFFKGGFSRSVALTQLDKMKQDFIDKQGDK